MKTQKRIFILLLLACFQFMTSDSFAEDIPTFDFSQGHDCSLLERDGISVETRNQRSSQSILNKKFKISLGEGKVISIGSETNQPVNSWAVVWCPPGETNLQFLALGSGMLTVEQTKSLLGQMRTAFGWGEDDFEKQTKSPNEFHKWLKINKARSPYYAVEVGTTYLKETPFYIKLTIAWDASVIEKQFPDQNRLMQDFIQHFKIQSNSPSASAR
jgi:hypothetical protein